MNKDLLSKHILSMSPISESVLDEILDKFNLECYPAKTTYIVENKIIDQSFFLEKGFVRSFVMDENGEIVTTNIFSAPCFVYDFTTFFKREPARQSFETVTDCEFYCMSLQNINTFFHLFAEYREFGRLMLLNQFILVEQRLLEMIRYSSEKRYLLLLRNHPDIIQNVPLNYIASYLGITKNSLSRLRKALLKK